jgi:hypothetical protein
VTSRCDSYLQGTRLRVTKLDACGAPVAGAGAYCVTKGFITLELDTDITKGTEIGPTLADGTRCFYQTTPPLLNYIKVSADFCSVDPELFNLMTGSTIVTDDSVSPVSIGMATDETTFATANFALELWTNLAVGSCPVSTNTGRRWGYYLLPWLVNGYVGKPKKIENGEINFSLTDAHTHTANQWNYGPYDIQFDRSGNASRLFTPLSSTAHDLLYRVNMQPPTQVCGAQALVLAT